MATCSKLLAAGTILASALSASGTGKADDTATAPTHTLGSVTTLDADRYRALEPGDAGSAAIAHVLADFQRRGDGEGGFAWWMKLPIAVRSRQANHSDARYWRNRIEFLRDAQRKDAVSCAISGRPVLADERLNCDYATELERYLDCTIGLPQARRASLFDELRDHALARLDADATRCPLAAGTITDVSSKLHRQGS